MFVPTERIASNRTTLSEMLKAGEIAQQLFYEGALNKKELEDIQSLSSEQPTRAAELLLDLVLRETGDFYDRFLDSLIKTKQHHVHQWIALEGL